ncbi:hypothetical protein DPMN_104876 [Dreissena polymorpha]|uniref:Uncharacterized protein n=1 Tax=Dreissena polymorpha TaxID=45954 RepID=A0A9D4K1G2_DREPO|nr:hypothetical protein DPMN_104876 [Dreissena polymorpha]
MQLNMKMKKEVPKRLVKDQTFMFKTLKDELNSKPNLKINSPTTEQSARSMIILVRNPKMVEALSMMQNARDPLLAVSRRGIGRGAERGRRSMT